MARTLAEAYVKLRTDNSALAGEATRAGETAGRALGDAVTRGADGRLRDSRDKFVSALDGSLGSAAGEGGRRAGTRAGSAMSAAMSGISFGGLVRGATGLIGVLGAAGIAGAAAKMGISTAASLEQAQIGFQTLLGSGERARTFLGDLQKFAASTPFELPGLIESSRTLLGVGVNAQQVVPMLTAFGNTAGAVGVGQENFQRIMLATSQAISSGRFMTEDLNQIMENGIPIWTILSKAMGLPVPKLREMASEGKLLTNDVLPILQAQMQKDYGGAMARQSQTLAGVWSTLKDTVSIGLANALQPLVPILTDLLPRGADLVSRGLSAASGAAASFIGGLSGRGPLDGFSGWLNTAGLGLRALVLSFREGDVTSGGFVGAMERVGVAARAVVDGVSSTVGWLRQHREVTLGLIGVVGALVVVTQLHAAVLAVQAAGGLAAYIAQINIVQAVTRVWTAVQWALNAAFIASPVGWIALGLGALVAALVLAYRNSDTFRSIVQAALQGVAEAGRWMWEVVLRPAFTALVGFWQNTVVPAALWLWHSVLEPAFRGIATTAQWLWSNVLQPAFTALVFIIQNVVAPVVLFLWRNIFEPAFVAIRFAVQVAISIVTTILGALVLYYRNVVGPVIMWLWQNVFGPAFSAIGSLVSAAWNNVIRPVFNALRGFVVDTLAPAVSSGIDGMGRAWNRLRDIARLPVEFVVRNVINPGIIRPWNVIAGLFGGTKVDEIKFAAGGVFPGYTPGRDVHAMPLAAFSGGEAVMRPEWTRAMGPDYVHGANAAARRGGVPAVMEFVGRYADGGILDALTNPVSYLKGKAQGLIDGVVGRFGGNPFVQTLVGFPRKVLGLAVEKAKGLLSSIFSGGGGGASPGFPPWPSSPGAQRGDSGVWRSIVALIRSTGPLSGAFGNAYRAGDPLWHGSGRAVDWMGFNQDALATFLAARGPLELIHRTGRRDYAYTRGRNMGSFDNALMEAHRNHVHIAMANGGLLPRMSMDTGFGVLKPGRNIIDNGTGGPEPIAAGPVRLDDWTIARLAQAMSARPIQVAVAASDSYVAVPGVAL